MIIKLPQLGNMNRFLDENFRNEVFLITEDTRIKCNGAILAARSSILEGMIQDSENVPVIEFSDNIPGLYSCLRIIYGGSVAIDENNYKNVYKFGKFFQIEEMVDYVLKWVNEELPYSLFWEVSRELKNLGASLETLKNAINRYCSDNRDEFLQNTMQICLDTNSSTDIVKVVLDMLPVTISAKNFLTFLSDLLGAMRDNGQTISSSTSNSTVVDWLGQHLPTCLEKLSSICKEKELFYDISRLENDTDLFDDIYERSFENLERELVERLTNPSTSFNTIRYFTMHAAKDIHPCVVGDIVLKLLRVTNRGYPDITSMEAVFVKIRYLCKYWFLQAGEERYRLLSLCICVGSDFLPLYKQYELSQVHNFGKTGLAMYIYVNEDLLRLKQFIEQGHGDPISIPVSNLITYEFSPHSYDFTEFRYDPDLFPPYGRGSGYWFLVFRYRNDSDGNSDHADNNPDSDNNSDYADNNPDSDSNSRFIDKFTNSTDRYINYTGRSIYRFRKVSLITERKEDILNHFTFSDTAFLFFVPNDMLQDIPLD